MVLTSTSWKSGQSGNIKGRPVGIKNKRQILNDELMLSYLESGDGFRVMEVIKNKALEGNLKACTLFCQYVFFKPESEIKINDQRIPNDEIAKILDPEQIKKIAEILLKNSKNESE